MKRVLRSVTLSIGLLLVFAAFAVAAALVVPQGTKVALVFDQALSSKTAKVGQLVRLHVQNDVFVGGDKVIRRGTAVQGVISKVSKHKHYGINAEMRLDIHPVASVTGLRIPLEPGGKGEQLKSSKTAAAAGATAGGAIVLGPIGLVGGYFIHGKPVKIKIGDTLVTQVVQDTVLTK